MTRTAAFLWTALAAAVCSGVVTLKVDQELNMVIIEEDLNMVIIESVAGFAFLLAISWIVAGTVFLLSRFKARRLTLIIVSAGTSVAVSIWAIVKFAT
jgi:hypothetical protein